MVVKFFFFCWFFPFFRLFAEKNGYFGQNRIDVSACEGEIILIVVAILVWKIPISSVWSSDSGSKLL